MPRPISIVLSAMLWLTCLAAPAAAEIVSVPFPVGIIGSIGQNTGKLTNLKNFASLGVTTGHFRQVSDNGRFGGTQGNDLSGTLRLVFENGGFVDVSGAINWRITTQGTVQYFGFIPEPGYITTLPGGTLLDDSSNYAVGKLDTMLRFDDGSDVSGNAALSGLVDELNLYLDAITQDAPSITGPSGNAGASAETQVVPEGTIPVWSYSSDGPVTWQTAGGADESLFSIDPVSGLLSFLLPPDFEAPRDQGQDNTYNVIVMATNANGVTATQSLLVLVTQVTSTPPMIDVRKTVLPVDLASVEGNCETAEVTGGAVFYQTDLCVEYVIDLSSQPNGSDPALNVTISDALPPDIEFVAITERAGFDEVAIEGDTLSATILVLEAGARATLRFRARVR